MKTVHDVQAQQLAGQTKLTAVSIYSNGKKYAFFVQLLHNARGQAILPQHILDRELGKVNARRYSICC